MVTKASAIFQGDLKWSHRLVARHLMGTPSQMEAQPLSSRDVAGAAWVVGQADISQGV